MPRYVDMTGQTIGLWRVLAKDPAYVKRTYWICECLGCGNTASVSGTHLREAIKGGCRACRTTTGAKKHPEEYKVWQNIKTRVFNSNRPEFSRYSVLGMYAPWAEDFMSFFHAVGARPSLKHSIDRIDNNKGYFPGNVRWATSAQQARNTSRNLTVNGEILIDYAKRIDQPYNTVRDWFHKGR